MIRNNCHPLIGFDLCEQYMNQNILTKKILIHYYIISKYIFLNKSLIFCFLVGFFKESKKVYITLNIF